MKFTGKPAHGFTSFQSKLHSFKHISGDTAPTSEFIRVWEMSGKFKFFQGQGIVREFCDVSGKNEILQKCQGNVREFYISAWWSWDVWSRCIFFAKFINFLAPILSGKFEFVSGKFQEIVREFWSVLHVWTLLTYQTQNCTRGCLIFSQQTSFHILIPHCWRISVLFNSDLIHDCENGKIDRGKVWGIWGWMI